MSRRVSAAAPVRVVGRTARLFNVGPGNGTLGASNGGKLGLPQRRASSYGSKSTQPRTDPRPLNDRGFQQECIRNLTGYLLTHGYNVPISTKLLVSPASKDVLNIVQFLFQKVDPNLKLSGKVEEDVPVVFKRLGYPFQISKSALYAAGSPHTWPGLLAALVWLIHLLLHKDAVESMETFDDSGARYFFENLSQSYQCFLAGDDDECERLDHEFRQQFEDCTAETVEKVAKLKVSEVQEQLRSLTTEVSSLVSLESKKADILSDKQKFYTVISSLQWHKEAAEKKLEERKSDLMTKKAEKNVIQADIEVLHNRVASQEINTADIDRMQKEKDLLDANTRPALLKDQELRKAAWDHELASTNKEKELELLCGEYNERSLRLKPILANGQPLSGNQWQITLQLESNVSKEILGAAVANGLKQAIFEVMESCKRYTNQEREEVILCEQEVYACEAARQDKLDLLSRLVATIKKLEALHKASKEKWEQAYAAMIKEREDLEAKVVTKELAAKRTAEDADKLVTQWELRYQAEVESCSEQIAAAKKQWIEVVDFILSAKEQVARLLQSLKTKTLFQAGRVKRDLPEVTAMIALQV